MTDRSTAANLLVTARIIREAADSVGFNDPKYADRLSDLAAEAEDEAEALGPPFASLPEGIDIARYFWEGTDRRNNGCEGIDLWRDGGDYCYLWVEAMVDQDMWETYLLDVRTNIKGDQTEKFTETRDFLFLHAGADNVFEVEWHNKPIRFDAPTDDHIDRLQDGLKWFAERIVGGAERYASGELP